MAMAEIYMDAETQRVADEVEGGWENIRAFGLSVAVTWDAPARAAAIAAIPLPAAKSNTRRAATSSR